MPIWVNPEYGKRTGPGRTLGSHRAAPAAPSRTAGQARAAPVPDREALSGILFVLRSGLPWEMPPKEMGCGSGMTCWRRLRDWHKAGVWQRLHETLLARLEATHLIDWSRASVDSIFIRAKGASLKGAEKGGTPAARLAAGRLARRLWTGAGRAPSATSR